ncbi:hypothetical protein ERO13_A08G086272v2 [Gossypium hirsutum]|nr:hypothetical protein ERO13_A08G086272v2 [Gossypium hirsutum]
MAEYCKRRRSLREEKQAIFTYLLSISIGDIAIERVPNADGDEGYRLLVDTEPTSSVEQRNESKVTEAFANLDSSFFEACFSLPLSPFLPSKIGHMEYSEVVRHQFLVPACKGSNPFTPDYEHPIRSVKNELMATGEATDCKREGKDRWQKAIPSNQPTRGVELNTTLTLARFFY